MILFAPACDDATRATHHIALRYRARASRESLPPPEERREWLRLFRDACDQAAESLDELGDFESPLEAYTCLHHLWDRLRVWLPLRGEPVHHPESTGSHITG